MEASQAKPTIGTHVSDYSDTLRTISAARVRSVSTTDSRVNIRFERQDLVRSNKTTTQPAHNKALPLGIEHWVPDLV
jgi:hypothetical protein